jgi:hypothetical protein
MKPTTQELLAQANQGVPPPTLSENDLDRLAEIHEAHHTDGRPITLNPSDPKEVAMELERLKRPQWRGTAKEL